MLVGVYSMASGVPPETTTALPLKIPWRSVQLCAGSRRGSGEDRSVRVFRYLRCTAFRLNANQIRHAINRLSDLRAQSECHCFSKNNRQT